MKNQDNNPGEKSQNDDKLKHLLRASLSREMSNPPRPDEITIRAYVNGSATADQKNIVRDAMMFSESFAEEMLEQMEAGQDLEDPELPVQMAKVEVPLEELMSRSSSSDSAIHVVVGGGSIGVWDKIRDFVWQPALGYGLAAVLLALILIPLEGEGPGGTTSVGVVSLNEYRVTRSGDESESFTPVRIEAGMAFVDLMVESTFDPAMDISFETTLKMAGDEIPLLFVGNNQRYIMGDSVLAYPVLRVDSSLLAPGRYVLRFVPVLRGGERREDLTKEARFDIAEEDQITD